MLLLCEIQVWELRDQYFVWPSQCKLQAIGCTEYSGYRDISVNGRRSHMGGDCCGEDNSIYERQ